MSEAVQQIAGFKRSLQTAADADGIATVLERASTGRATWTDKEKLVELAERYRRYASALREAVTVETAPAEDADQLSFLEDEDASAGGGFR